MTKVLSFPADGRIERLLYDGNDLIAEYSSAGTMLDRYVHGVSGGDDPAIADPLASAISWMRRWTS